MQYVYFSHDRALRTAARVLLGQGPGDWGPASSHIWRIPAHRRDVHVGLILAKSVQDASYRDTLGVGHRQ